MVVEVLLAALISVMVITVLVAVSAFKHTNLIVKTQEWEDYRKRAMKGLIFEDNWTPEDIDKVFIEKRIEYLDSKKTQGERDLEAEQSAHI